MEFDPRQKPTANEREQFRLDSAVELMGEVRAIAWMIVFVNIILAVEDWFILPEHITVLYSLKLFMVLIMLWMIVLSRTHWGKKHAENFFMIGSVFLASLIVLQAWMLDISYLTPMVSAFAVAVSAGVLSWRLRYHFIIMGVFYLAVFANNIVFFGELAFPLPQETMAGLSLITTSIFLAFYSDQRRFTLWKTRHALAASEARFRQFAESSQDIIWIWSPNEVIQYISPAFEKFAGTPPTDLYRDWRTVLRIVHPDDRRIAAQAVRDINGGKECTVNLRMLHQNGKIYFLEGWGTPIFNANGDVIRCIGAWRDVTERETLIRHLDDLSITDPLTQIYNRRFFFDFANKEVDRATRNEKSLSVILFDIDHFKDVNDTWGHAIGDQVLVHISELCQTFLRNEDVFARYGGEEFAILLPETSLTAACVTAQRLREAIAESAIKIGEAHELGVTVSLGVSSWHKESPLDFKVLLHQADQALYRSKEAGRNKSTSWEAVESL